MAYLRMSASWAIRISAAAITFFFSLLHLSAPTWAKAVETETSQISSNRETPTADLIAAFANDEIFERRLDIESARTSEFQMASSHEEKQDSARRARGAVQERKDSQPQQALKLKDAQPQQALKLKDSQPQQAAKVKESQPR